MLWHASTDSTFFKVKLDSIVSLYHTSLTHLSWDKRVLLPLSGCELLMGNVDS